MTMFLLSLVVGLLLVLCPAEAVDTRTLQRNRTSSPSSRESSQPTFEQVVARLSDLSARYRTIEEELDDILDSQDNMRHSMRGHNSIMDRLQPLIDSVAQLSEMDRRLSSVESRVSERCSCGDGGGGIVVPPGGSDREESGFDGWIERLDREQIEDIRNGFNSARGKGKGKDKSRIGGLDVSDSEEDDDNDVHYIGEQSLRLLSRVFTNLVIQEAEAEGIDLESDITTTKRPTIATVTEDKSSRGTNSRKRPKPRPGFPFNRAGRSVDKLSRYPRETTQGNLERDVYDLFSELDRAKKKCAFSAIRTEPLFGEATVPKSIGFQKSQANKGKSFKKENGVFTCEIPGLYYFSYTMRTYDGKLIGTALMLNGDPVVGMTTDASNRKVMQTQSIMLTLKVGDEVWLLLGPSDGFALYGNDFNYNTFNGVLMIPA
ncbi:uncharacterized protein [Ptychodera flava]|uniref:uncharacterized protein n=1 Tax=Ptychodera flava TaxID=63121 RepID=UPI00396AA530